MKKMILKAIITGVMVSTLSSGVTVFAADESVTNQSDVVNEINEVVEDDEITIVDFALDKGIRENLGLGENDKITKSLLATIKELDLSDYGIASVYELQWCTNLEKLDISNANSIYSYEFIENLPNLKEVIAVSSDIYSIESFAKIPNLEKLDVSDNHIRDISLFDEKIKSGKMKSLIASNQSIVLDRSFDRKYDKVETSIVIDGMYDPVKIESLNDQAVYDNANNNLIITWNTPKEEQFMYLDFEDTIKLDTTEYEYSGTITVYFSFFGEENKDDNQEAVKPQEDEKSETGNQNSTTQQNTQVSTNTKSAKSQKTGDASMALPLTAALTSLAGLGIFGKRK